MAQRILDPGDLGKLEYLITHVFCPLQLPSGDDHTTSNDHMLCKAVISAARLYSKHVDKADLPEWRKILQMLDNLCAVVQVESFDSSQISPQLARMGVGDVLVFFIRAQNAAVVFRKQQDVTIFETFEVSPKAQDVMTTKGKLVCSYPGPAIEIPNHVFSDHKFRAELVNYLDHMNKDVLDAAATSRKASSTVQETRDTTHPRYITELLTGILRSLGRPANIARISKRVGDDVVWNNSELPWRRSSLWLIIRVAIQTSLNRSATAHDTYKTFMLFFMCCLANESVSEELSNDHLQFILAKISRRSSKIGSVAPVWLSETVVRTCTDLRSTLDERWEQVQAAQRVSPVWIPSQLNLSRDVQLSLKNCGNHIRDLLARRNLMSVSTKFSPKHSPRGILRDFLSSDGAFFEESYRAEPYTTLYDVERAVEGEIDQWVDRVTDSDEACEKLELLGKRYSSNASKTYANNPELMSVMLLTIVELWVALDKIVVKEIPLLTDYSPEIPTSLLEQLLFSKSASLRRLHLAHQYLTHRHSCSRWSAFSPAITPDSFAVRFFRGSSRLQSLKDKIERDAQREVREKVNELERKNAEYAELQRQSANEDHEYTTDWWGNDRHAKCCHKCALESRCKKMKITVHEWPLPAERLCAEVVVFELSCPVSFNMWRSATFNLLVDTCSSISKKKSPYIMLGRYSALQRYLVQHPRSRITLASDTKPFIVTHYKTVSIPAGQGQVCVNNGLRFYGFDSCACIPASELLDGVDIHGHCTHTLPAGEYKNLQRYVDSTLHSSNEIMANQVDCATVLSIHEYLAFGHLRSGGLLQWLNILRELRARSLTFRRSEVHLLLAQAILQVGPLQNMQQEWHRELKQPSFCCALLEELNTLIRDVEANWLELATMDTISLLLRRLLASLSLDPATSLQTIKLLRSVREKVFTWVQELSKKLRDSLGDESLSRYLRDASAVCRSTFDVDFSMIPELLHSAEDVMILVCCAVFIHDHTPSQLSGMSLYSKLLLDRDRRFSLAVEDCLHRAVQADPNDDGMDLAIEKLWVGYRPGSKWTALQHPNSRWMSSETALTAKECSQLVHYNLLNGSLLVDGKPLGRLPSNIQEHPLYNLLFGNRVLDITPSDLPGMDYSTRGLISVHRVHFSLRNKHLVIRATRKTAGRPETTELIPPEKMKDDLPAVFIEGHAHWLNIDTSTLEIRPLSTVWETSSENWTICCAPGQYRMQKGHEVLVDIRSKTWEKISTLLRPLEIPSNLVITASTLNPLRSSLSQLFVALPRYGLSFYVDEDGDLQSRNMRGMVYDENQSIGTLFGLVNQLVLRPKRRITDEVDLIPRCVLIPDGKASYNKVGHHVRVEIDTHGPTLERITYQTFKVDTELGCLTGTVSLTNKLYCVYLHALTSGCGADPLTGRSGTEEALSLLRSAGCWSIIRFTHRDEALLSSIASLCPLRTWYPTHLQCMQQVTWRSLPAASQHHDLYIVSKAIKEHYNKLSLFHEDKSGPSFRDFPSQDDSLLERSARRAVYLFPPEMSAKPIRSNADVSYPARDLVNGSGELRAYTAATTIFHRTYPATTTTNILTMMESWRAPISGGTTLSLRYDKLWLSPNLSSIWLEMYRLLRKGEEKKWFQMLFSLPAMAYASCELDSLVPIFVAFASSPQFRREDPPSYPSYTILDGYAPSEDTLHGYFSDCACSFDRSPESSEPARQGESVRKLRKRQLRAYNNRRDLDANVTVTRLLDSWPCETLPWLSLDRSLYDQAEFISNAQSHFSSCSRNLKLKEHIGRVQRILEAIESQPISYDQYSFQPSKSPLRVVKPLVVDELFARPAPSLRMHDRLPRDSVEDRNMSPLRHAPLHRLIATAKKSAENPFQHQYVSALHASAKCLGRESSLVQVKTSSPASNELVAHYIQCKNKYVEAIHELRQCLGPRTLNEHAVELSGQWPRITPYTLFRFLASNSPTLLSGDWKGCLIDLTMIALELQRARRLLRLHLDNLTDEVQKELQNEGCDGWSAEAHPDWLLIQLQCNFLVRHVQADVSQEMMSPCSGENTAMQLNMGEGKSSVIVPIIVVDLANGGQLVRVIVPKALTVQMFHILADRLSGLVNRRLYFVPFSRSVHLNDHNVIALRELMKECMEGRGILIVQPEHILSLRLLSVEKQLPLTKQTRLAGQLLELQRWLHSHSRDILDESDEILHVRYQLVYTIGTQEHMEGFPKRWTTTQQVLGLVGKRASSLKKLFPLGVEYECGPPGSFAHLRILHADAGRKLIAGTVQDILNGNLPNFNFGQLRSSTKDLIRSFISNENVHLTHVQLVKDFCQDTSLWGGLLHLRGLLASGILLFALTERRWRVDYGLAPARTMLAVPYRAKDVPAQRAEFGHPDIAIVLTSLSYYYGGLSEKQLKLSFEILLKQDDPSLNYGAWVQECPTVPDSLRTLNGINMSSSNQWNKDLYPLFWKNRATIDFYLSNVVFPKEAKEFPSKLSCSGWDLAEKKRCLLTGFSGTNDGQYILPLHITQRDPDHQRGTNAKVLSYLLQPENNYYMCMTHDDGERRSTREFLEILVAQNPAIRVLLDVGAQMLDLQNRELAEAWLDINSDASAAIYFNNEDELMVCTRDGRTQPLHSSPFAQQLDQCVVYLDDAHTRGTDIKFPLGFRAAVTLGPKVTKDRLVQGCMRMRKLGQGHSVIFFAPLEIDKHIRTVAKKSPKDVIDTMDILHWAIRETCNDIQQRAPHWAQQGMDHTVRYAVWTAFCEGQLASQELSDKWLQPEAKKLEELYAPRNNNLFFSASPDIQRRCSELGVLKLRDVGMDEEQEREVIHEAERECQVERPPKVPAACHSVHRDVVEFIKTGIVPTKSKAFCSVFEMLHTTSAAFDESHVWSPCLLATMDFVKPIDSSGKLDEYLRPVNWIVSGKRGHKAAIVVLSPHEVNHLMPSIRSSRMVHLHLYTPRVIQSMKPCDDLTFYNIPTVPARWTPSSPLVDQLNVFAGQLYLRNYKTYIQLCRFLCVYAKDLQGEDIEVGCDGFIEPNNRPQHLRSVYTFQRSPLNPLKTLMALRRKGMSFAPTDMGKILDGRLLDEDHFLNWDDVNS